MMESGKNCPCSHATKGFAAVAVGLFFLMGVVVMIWQMTGPSWFKNIKAEVTNQPYARTVTVDGEGKITAKPDIALVTLSVVSQGKTVKVVTEDGNAKMTAVIDAVKKLGIDSKDVATSTYNLYPQYIYPQNKPQQLTGYSLEQGITVKVRDLTKVDDVLDEGTKTGANQVGQLTFDIDDTSSIKKDARTEAFKKAHEKAADMAAAAGVSLGRVVTFSEGYSQPPTPVYANYAMDVKAGSAASERAPSIEPGSKDLVVDVSITYEIQ
jgi:uncharacterized protein